MDSLPSSRGIPLLTSNNYRIDDISEHLIMSHNLCSLKIVENRLISRSNDREMSLNQVPVLSSSASDRQSWWKWLLWARQTRYLEGSLISHMGTVTGDIAASGRYEDGGLRWQGRCSADGESCEQNALHDGSPSGTRQGVTRESRDVSRSGPSWKEGVLLRCR